MLFKNILKIKAINLMKFFTTQLKNTLFLKCLTIETFNTIYKILLKFIKIILMQFNLIENRYNKLAINLIRIKFLQYE